MTNRLSKVVCSGLLAAGLLSADRVGAEDAKPAQQAPVMQTANDLKWVDAPPVLPKGAKLATLSGDMGKAGVFTIRLKFPAGYKIPPHFHGGDEHVTVVSGTLQVALGDSFDASKLKTLPVGSFAMMPAGSHHYAFAKEESVIQVTGEGPFTLTYVNPADDPQMKK